MSEANQKIQEYLQKNHKQLFNNDLTEKQNLNDLLFNLFGSEILTGDKKATVRKQKAKYLKSLNSLETSPGTNEGINNKTELENIQQSELTTEAKKETVNSDVNTMETLNNTQLSIKELFELFHRQQSELDSIKETLNKIDLNKQIDIVNNELEIMQVNTTIEKIKNYDMKNADRQTFYVTDVNSQLINDFYKSNQINKSSLLNFIISSWFENNVTVNNTEPEGITEPTKPKQLF